MSIEYFESIKTWKLDTPHSSYVIHVVDDEGFLVHGYYGRRFELQEDEVASKGKGSVGLNDLRYSARLYEHPFLPSNNDRDRGIFLDSAPFEYPAYGTGDFRDCAIEVETQEGHRAITLLFEDYRIYPGKPALAGLPATFAGEDEADTLELHTIDRLTGLSVILFYTVFKKLDVITRSVIVENTGKAPIWLDKVMSLCLDMDNEDYEALTLHGGWAKERHIERRPVPRGRFSVGSLRGESSHQENPFLAILDQSTTQEQGRVYGFNFVYSGNFIAQTEVSQFDSLRVLMGIHPTHFKWKLAPGESFTAPEVVMVYSDGLDQMTHTFHDLYRTHLIRSPYRDKKRPILINNWEATYFDFDSDKLIGIAKQAAELGIEMLVMDDGWFGERNDDNSSLGDWFVNEKKLKGGLKALVDKVNSIRVKGSGEISKETLINSVSLVGDAHERAEEGTSSRAFGAGKRLNQRFPKMMQFGIWVEPEMISPDSALYREHPDYAIGVPGRRGTLLRNQYVLDLSRPEVVELVYKRIREVIGSANIVYVKWDMNRALTDVGNATLPADRAGELLHRYMLGVYELQERLVTDFPELLLENCSGGGGRFDPGMLYYSPQIWCSDDTDAIERLLIQEGTALCYPLSAMGAHVSDCPNHEVFRTTPFKTRGEVALFGTFGYELDVTKISEEEREQIKRQTELYHKYHLLIQNGDYYRLASYRENHYYDCIEVVSKDRTEAIVLYVQVLGRPNHRSTRIRLRGLSPEAVYEVCPEDRVLGFSDRKKETEEAIAADIGSGRQLQAIPADKEDSLSLTGSVLMNLGLTIGSLWGDFVSTLIYLTSVR